ncbi:ferredoxin reductase domain-containing protein [Elstera litoralis]|uniref:hypothetical protein n=1 Tax=Elstera litoralis TaxID=552518 RepID=UPI000696E779|nr:hypothetical protein [Elstera litoralis]
MQVRLAAIRAETSRVKSFRLEEVEGSDLCCAEAGAHIRLTLPLSSGPETRAYSLWRAGGRFGFRFSANWRGAADRLICTITPPAAIC